MIPCMINMFVLLLDKYAQDKVGSSEIVAVIILGCKVHLENWWLAVHVDCELDIRVLL